MDFTSAAYVRFARNPPVAGVKAEETFPLTETGAQVVARATAGAVA